MKFQPALTLGLVFLALGAPCEVISVPGRANPWLAGMTNGSMARRGDSAPDQSPIAVTSSAIEAGALYTFSVSGSANHGSPTPFVGPDGEELISHYLGAENGIADITAPFVSLLGVFLGPNVPDQTPAPPSLDFRNASDRDYFALAPALKQPFFIGDGLTSAGVVQQVIAPSGATRLFLGIMDEYAWYDNEGAFEVKVLKETSTARVKLFLHPSVNPSTADAEANTAKAIITPKIPAGPPVIGTAKQQTKPKPANVTPGSPDPDLHAFTAVELGWSSEAGLLYQVQWTTSLTAPEWENLGSAVVGTGDKVSVFDSTRTHPQGFYRVRVIR
jgi:hypothetical protein